MYLLHFNSLQWFNVLYSNQTTKPNCRQHLKKCIQKNAHHFFFLSTAMCFLTPMLPAHHWICAGALLLGQTPLAPSSTSSAAGRGAKSSTSLWYPWAWLATSTISVVKDRMRGFEKRVMLMSCYNFLLFMLISNCGFVLWIHTLCLIYSPFISECLQQQP